MFRLGLPNFSDSIPPELRERNNRLNKLLDTDYDKLLNKDPAPMAEPNNMVIYAAFAALALYVFMK